MVSFFRKFLSFGVHPACYLLFFTLVFLALICPSFFQNSSLGCSYIFVFFYIATRQRLCSFPGFVLIETRNEGGSRLSNSLTLPISHHVSSESSPCTFPMFAANISNFLLIELLKLENRKHPKHHKNKKDGRHAMFDNNLTNPSAPSVSDQYLPENEMVISKYTN